MPRTEAPLIDGRTYDDLVAEVETLLQSYTSGTVAPEADRLAGTLLDQPVTIAATGETFPAGTRVSRELAERLAGVSGLGLVRVQGWRPTPGAPDAGQALTRIFGRMAELVVTRLNRLPDRNFLAFLDLIGTRLNPPQPARVPLTFLLAAGSPVDALVPAGTQAVATALEGDAEPPLFETERDLVVTRSRLVAVCTREPGRDLWADHTGATSFEPFRGDRPIEHRLHLSHPLLGLPEAKTVELRISPAAASHPWPSAVEWSVGRGAARRVLAPVVSLVAGPPAVWSVRFDNLSGLPAETVAGSGGHWLAGTLQLSLPAGGSWPLPQIESLQVSVRIDRTGATQGLVPERGFTNQSAADLSKDVLPFGDKPKVGDVLYLACEEALAKAGAAVDLTVAPTNPSDTAATPPPAASSNALLTWEFWNGSGWELLGRSGPGAVAADTAGNATYAFSDTTNGFLAAGTVHFNVPAALAAVAVEGELRRWIRVRIARGDYGVEARYVRALDGNGNPRNDINGLPLYQLTPATFRPPSLRTLRLGYLLAPGFQTLPQVLAENDFSFADVTAAAAPGGGSFTPFVPAAVSGPTLYLGFERPGEAMGFANRAASLFFQASEALYDPALSQGEVTEEASVVWEHWNGADWERLGARDETRGFTRHGLVTFIGPARFPASTELGRTAFWLRARWDRGEYAVEPRLDRILTNTTWAVHAQTLLGEVLGSSRGERGQVFRTRRAPVLDGPQLEVIEPEIPSAADRAELEAEEGTDAVAVVRDASGRTREVRVRWHEVPDFYGSGPRSRHYVVVHATGEIRFGDGRRGLIPPPGRNNVRMVRYQAGGGLAGNRPAGSIGQLKGTVPYVDGVVQQVAAQGGAAEESLEAVRVRGPKALRHRDRATAAVDFEDLAFQASSQVARARALPARRGPEGGQVGLIIVPASPAARPTPDLELLARVRSYVEARLSPVVDFWVVGPDWLQLDVHAEVVPRELETAAGVQTTVLERLRAFLHPLTGGPDGEGWDFGRKPHRSDLYALIEDTPGVDHVRRLELRETPREGGARAGRFLVFSGDHEITLSGNTDEAAASGSPS